MIAIVDHLHIAIVMKKEVAHNTAEEVDGIHALTTSLHRPPRALLTADHQVNLGDILNVLVVDAGMTRLTITPHIGVTNYHEIIDIDEVQAR